MDEDFHVKRNQAFECICRSCFHLRRSSSTIQPYRCFKKACRIQFDSFTALFEHQLDVHGQLDPRGNRVVDDLFHQQHGTLALPPATVYIGQQYMVPTRPPTPWKSMEELEEEAETLLDRLITHNCDNFTRVWGMFKTAYKLVKRNGKSEMERQYQITIEHFNSSFKFSAASRGFHDGCPSVESGRNWLVRFALLSKYLFWLSSSLTYVFLLLLGLQTSTDRQDAQWLHPFSLGDRRDVEPEFVLIDTKRDQEMYEEASDESDAEGDTMDDQLEAGKKDFKTDDDVEMESEYDGFKSTSDQPLPEKIDVKPIIIDSDSDSESDDDRSTDNRKVFKIDVNPSGLENANASDSESDSSEIDGDKTASNREHFEGPKRSGDESDSESESDSDSDDDKAGGDQQSIKSDVISVDGDISSCESDSDSEGSSDEEDHTVSARGSDEKETASVVDQKLGNIANSNKSASESESSSGEEPADDDDVAPNSSDEEEPSVGNHEVKADESASDAKSDDSDEEDIFNQLE
ncbi:unnamed protein product [Phytophthora lilii]|uniref:Unnamed protein product n=1 Tax=Phytophthora lilii TaxID=2077276 RepID=A0A9W6TH39_9STRA|nr:unnamed protein product [Phytophthora lilii]